MHELMDQDFGLFRIVQPVKPFRYHLDHIVGLLIECELHYPGKAVATREYASAAGASAPNTRDSSFIDVCQLEFINDIFDPCTNILGYFIANHSPDINILVGENQDD